MVIGLITEPENRLLKGISNDYSITFYIYDLTMTKKVGKLRHRLGLSIVYAYDHIYMIKPISAISFSARLNCTYLRWRLIGEFRSQSFQR